MSKTETTLAPITCTCWTVQEEKGSHCGWCGGWTPTGREAAVKAWDAEALLDEIEID